ncbi:MAG: homoserine kinase [Gammaproteobacteria bacterium]|nr:homoserine kinase [Gammaproteobacteria bacterium]
MSVYTTINQDELIEFLDTYPAGELVEYTGISDGIENTNYFVSTNSDRYVLTLFEEHSAEEMPYFLDLMAHLAEHGVPSAHPIADNAGQYLRELKRKPAALVQRLRGASVTHANTEQCAALGAALGHLHTVGQSFVPQRDNPRGAAWWSSTCTRLLPKLDTADAELIQHEIEAQSQHNFTSLPHGVIHADLFRDNALWEGDHLTGIIDFYYACSGTLLYDLAITVNDWCTQDNGSLDTQRSQAMLHAYAQQRTFLNEENAAWPMLLRAAALRFWLSRLQDYHFPREGEMTHTKDPQVYKNILLGHIQQPTNLA